MRAHTPLRQILGARPETVSEFVLAAEERFWSTAELAVAGRRGDAISLFGYTAEMLLKVAALRFDGATAADLVRPRLAPAANWLNARPAATVAPESYHSIIFWTTYLRQRRSDRARALPSMLDGELVHRARRLYGIWWIEMRYRSD